MQTATMTGTGRTSVLSSESVIICGSVHPNKYTCANKLFQGAIYSIDTPANKQDRPQSPYESWHGCVHIPQLNTVFEQLLKGANTGRSDLAGTILSVL